MRKVSPMVVVAAAGIALVASLLSMFHVRPQAEIPAEFRIEHIVQGATIVCDTREGTQRSICIGEYERGWPILVGEGYIVGSSDSRWNEQFDFMFANFLSNAVVWFAPALVLSLTANMVVARRSE